MTEITRTEIKLMPDKTLINQTGAVRALADTIHDVSRYMSTAASGYSTTGMDQHEVNETLARLVVIEHAAEQLRNLLEEKS